MFIVILFNGNHEVATKCGFQTREDAINAAETEIRNGNGSSAQVARKLA